jgi:hypothetical protein
MRTRVLLGKRACDGLAQLLRRARIFRARAGSRKTLSSQMDARIEKEFRKLLIRFGRHSVLFYHKNMKKQ